MATQYNGRLMASGRQQVQGGLALKKMTLSSQVWVDVSNAANDTYYFGKLPKGAVVTGGRLYSGRLASGVCAASTLLALTVGFDHIMANQSGTTYSVASLTSALGFFGPISFTTATEGASGCTMKFESGFSAPFGGILLINGPLTTTTDPTAVFATLSASAGSQSGISGYLNIELDYYTGTYS